MMTRPTPICILASLTTSLLSLSTTSVAAPLQATGRAQNLSAALKDLATKDFPTKDLLETARAASFRTLVSLVESAGLADVLRGEGPLTVFAPTDDAFAALPTGTLESLLLPENREELRAILAHHVVPGRLISYEVANVEDPQMARTAGGGRERIGADGRRLLYGDATVLRADVACTNGIIHVIDRVVLPKALPSEDQMRMAMKEAEPASLLDALREIADGRFSTFLAAVEASGGDQDWAQPEPSGNWTVLVPTNEAFARLTEAERAMLLDPKNRDLLRAVLDWHAVPTLQAWSFDVDRGQRSPTMISQQGDRFVLDVLGNGMVFVYRLRSAGVDRAAEEPFKARIVAGDVPVGGSVVHVIDRVLIPPQFEGRAIASQAYREKDVKAIAMGGEAQFSARLVFADMLRESDALGDEAAIVAYQMGLRMLEDVLPVSRSGMLLTRDANRNDRASLEARFRARVDDLDRVWYAAFMKNSPAVTLDVPLPGSIAPTVEKKPEAVASPASNAAPRTAWEAPPKAAAAESVVRPAATAAPAALDWCEVLDREADPAVVTDAAIREAIAATGLPWRVRDRTSGIEMLLVPPGTFRMGRSDGDRNAMSNEAPAHQVAITRPYYLGRFEVTQGEWTKVMGSDPRSRPRSAPESDGGLVIGEGGGTIIVRGRVGLVDQKGNALETVNVTEQNEDGTVTFTTIGVDPEQEREAADPRPELPAFAGWSSASDFCRRAGLRLPTEAEWEYACRAGVDAPRYGALDAIAWHRGNAVGRRHPVGTKAANALGFHDMIGNAWEWVNDWYAEYTRTPKLDPAGPDGGRSRIIRGGYFDENDPYYCRASLRYGIPSPDFAASTGFRVARSP